MSTLLIDIGNSRIKWRAVAADGRPIADAAALALADVDQLVERWKPLRPHRAVVSNVAGDRIGDLVEGVLRGLAPNLSIDGVVPVREAAGVLNGYRDVAQLGPDRWLAMIGARALWPARSLLVCSFGTATTIDLLSAGGDAAQATFVGGLILPGIETMRDSLVRKTARLAAHPGKVVELADNTDDAITSGIVAAQIGAINETLRHARSRADIDRLACVVAGGASSALGDRLKTIDVPVHVVADLVLHGLAVFAQASGVRQSVPHQAAA